MKCIQNFVGFDMYVMTYLGGCCASFDLPHNPTILILRYHNHDHSKVTNDHSVIAAESLEKHDITASGLGFHALQRFRSESHHLPFRDLHACTLSYYLLRTGFLTTLHQWTPQGVIYEYYTRSHLTRPRAALKRIRLRDELAPVLGRCDTEYRARPERLERSYSA